MLDYVKSWAKRHLPERCLWVITPIFDVFLIIYRKGILAIIESWWVRLSPPDRIRPEALHTPNRGDIDVRVDFLRAVLDEGRDYQNTTYYHFIDDKDRKATIDADAAAHYFLALYHDIKANGIQEPLDILKVTGETVRTEERVAEEWITEPVPNTNNYQLMDGAHRLGIALYLGFDSVPVFVHRVQGKFRIPNYTAFLKIKGQQYPVPRNNGKHRSSSGED